MACGTLLTDFEKGQIGALSSQNLSACAIGHLIGRFKNVVLRLLQDPVDYASSSRPGPFPIISDRAHRLLLRVAANGDRSACQLKSSLKLPVSTRRVRKLLNQAPHLVHEERRHTPVPTKEHKEARVKWAETMVSWKHQWNQVVWSDEKKFNLDGPDGFQFYWRDLRK